MIEVLIAGLFIVAFGGMILILVLGAQEVEGEVKVRETEARGAPAEFSRLPDLLVTPPARPRVSEPNDVLQQLQQYLDAEQTFADEFVAQPSIESLYRETERKLSPH